MKNWARNMVFVISIALIVFGCVFMFMGFDKKDNYHNPESYLHSSKNAYVGGDAYNYIINSNYFTGYLTLASACFICGTILFTTGVLTKQQENTSSPRHYSDEMQGVDPIPYTGNPFSNATMPTNDDAASLHGKNGENSWQNMSK